MIWPHGMDSLFEFIDHLNIVHPTIEFTSDISHTEISFLDLTIYIKQSQLHTSVSYMTTDRHMYLTYFSEHAMSCMKLIPYSQFLRLKTRHPEPQYLLEAQIHMYLFFTWQEYPHDMILRYWMKTNEFTREQLLTSENKKIRIYHLCLSQHTVGPIPTSRNSFPNIGLTWADQAPQEILEERTS